MGFLGVFKALYDYAPQSEEELQISEGDLLYVLEKSEEDDWWKVKKRAGTEEEDEPVGLIPNNYVEEVPASSHARALYEYTRQTDEELSFPEDAALEVFDTSDPDWILVGYEGDYGFAPSNYIEMAGASGSTSKRAAAAAAVDEDEGEEESPPGLPTRPAASATVSDDLPSPPLPQRHRSTSESSSRSATNPAAALAGVLGGRTPGNRAVSTPMPPSQRQVDVSDDDDEPTPPLPARPRAQSATSDDREVAAPPVRRENNTSHSRRSSTRGTETTSRPQELSPLGFHIYNINEMVHVMGKKKKMPTALGINLKTGMILIAPEHAQDGPSLEWSAEKMTHYSREGKHLFMELVRPSKSVDFHAGAKDTAEEIVAALGEMAGAVRAEGLREVIAAGSGQGQKKGKMLYEFMAQGDDEVTVAEGDEVVVLDDSKSEDWWQVRRVRNGKEGVVPASYVEMTGISPLSPTVSSTSGINAGRSTVAQNRLEEERLTKEAMRAARYGDDGGKEKQKQRDIGRNDINRPKTKPDSAKLRTWTDRSKSFKVDAQFLGMKDGKLNLHKMNGVKIAVPISKMSVADLEYVERVTGISLDEDKPLSEVKRSKNRASSGQNGGSSGATIGTSSSSSAQPKKPEYDWFQFFLSCDIAVGLCERYAQAFARDSMDESVLPDVNASILRTLGLKEGDIIKVTRFLDNKYGRSKKEGAEDGEAGGLFSGPGGALRNNTRRGRPEGTRQVGDVVDPKALSQRKESVGDSSSPIALTPATTTTSVSANKKGVFDDDDAWDVKPAKQQQQQQQQQPTGPTPSSPPAPPPIAKTGPSLTPGQQDLSLLSQPLEPTRAVPVSTPTSAPAPAPAPAPVQVPQATGATPSFFNGLPNGQASTPLNGPLTLARQRPVAPQNTSSMGGLQPPPPARPFSAPLSAQPSQFGPPPLMPQVTGVVAPPGQSLLEINQARMLQQQQQQQFALQQQQQQFLQQNMTGYASQQAAIYPQSAGLQQLPPQMTGLQAYPGAQFQQQQQQAQQGQFSDPRTPQFTPIVNQLTGFPLSQQQQPPQFRTGSVNDTLPPALIPQPTGYLQQQQQQQQQPLQPQATGHFTQGFGNAGMPQNQQQLAPLVPQQTGPPPPVRFGVAPPANKLVPEPTGRRANLSAATPQNPFGF